MCVAVPNVHAGKVIVLDGWLKHRVGKNMDVFVDVEKTLSIQDVAAIPYDGQFEPVDADVPNLGITESVVWARFTVLNESAESKLKYLSFEFPLADYVTFFIPRKGGFEQIDAGHAVRLTKKLIPNRYYVFPFRVGAGEQKTFYVRVKSSANMVLPMSIWEPAALDRKDHRDQMIFGIIYGVWLAFIGYFAALALKLRNPVAMWFTFYIIFLGMLLSSYQGYLQEMLRPALADLSALVLIALIGLLYFTGAKFFRTFLNIGSYSRRTDRIIQGLQWMGLGFIPMNLFPNPLTPFYAIVLVGLGPLFSTTVSVVLWIKGAPNAKYFALGWIIGHLTSEVDLLRVLGIIPWIPGTVYLIPAAIISAILFFSIAIIEQSREYREYADKDGLTGIANRRFFDTAFSNEWNRHLRSQRHLAVLIADIDDFKAFNDTYGHPQGDTCLKAVGGTFARMLRRAGDLAARYGGEEFVGLLPETDTKQAEILAERIRSSVENLSITHASSGTAKVVTVSIGVAAMVPDSGKGPAQLLSEADKALYQAKKSGRNRVVPANV